MISSKGFVYKREIRPSIRRWVRAIIASRTVLVYVYVCVFVFLASLFML